MSRAVADATVLIYLAKLGDLHMLDEFFGSILGSTSLSEIHLCDLLLCSLPPTEEVSNAPA